MKQKVVKTPQPQKEKGRRRVGSGNEEAAAGAVAAGAEPVATAPAKAPGKKEELAREESRSGNGTPTMEAGDGKRQREWYEDEEEGGRDKMSREESDEEGGSDDSTLDGSKLEEILTTAEEHRRYLMTLAIGTKMPEESRQRMIDGIDMVSHAMKKKVEALASQLGIFIKEEMKKLADDMEKKLTDMEEELNRKMEKKLNDKLTAEIEQAKEKAQEVAGGVSDTLKSAYWQLRDVEKSGRSIMIYGVDDWQMTEKQKEYYRGVPDEESITEELLTLTKYRIAVTDCVVFRARDITAGGATGRGKIIGVKVTLGSASQKRILYRRVAEVMRAEKPEDRWGLEKVSFRDCFPNHQMEQMNKMVQDGMELKKTGKVASFRVVARGVEVVPTLEVKETRGGRWFVSSRGRADGGQNQSKTVRKRQQSVFLNDERMKNLWRVDPFKARQLYAEDIANVEAELAKLKEQQQQMEEQIDMAAAEENMYGNDF
jgi:hypothetical protein